MFMFMARVSRSTAVSDLCIGAVGVVAEYWTRNREVAGSTHTRSTSSIAGTKMIPFPPYKAPQTQPRLPSHTKK